MSLHAVSIESNTEPQSYEYIVVGTGPVGVHFIQEQSKLNSTATIAVFGDEPWDPYNRIQLSSLISGDIKEQSLYSASDLKNLSNVTTFYNNRIVEINRVRKEITDSLGNKYFYGKLILATGSRPHIPLIDGIKLNNIFTFRDLSDAQRLMSRSVRTQKTVIIGGGLLGLEAARAMQRFNTEVHIIEHSSWLMFNQLDNRAGGYLKQYIESLGIYIHTNERIQKIVGSDKAEGVLLSNDTVIECDTIIIAAGIIPNNELAKESGINFGKGIRVNDFLQTNDQNIFAIGECSEHNHKTYGLVAPGFEQASVLAHFFNGEKAQYKGSTATTNLKVLDYAVFSAGNTGIAARARECFIYQDHEKEVYRKIVIINGRIRGAIGIGEWPGVQRIQEAVEHQRRMWPWQIKRFITDGLLWNDSLSESVIDWPSTAIVCNCTGVTRGQLSQSIKQGSTTVVQLSKATGASTVCGSCKHLLTDFVGGNAAPEPTKGFRYLMTAAVISLAMVLIALFLPSLSYSNSVQNEFMYDILWRDSLYKQISGFTLLGFSLFISIISIRKRVTKILNLWDYAYWRLMHVVIGALVIGVLLTHTGFRFGTNLNFYLMLVFCSLILLGSIASIVISYEHNLPRRLAKQIRSYAVWSHIVLLWPFPVLLGFHILKTYYY